MIRLLTPERGSIRDEDEFHPGEDLIEEPLACSTLLLAIWKIVARGNGPGFVLVGEDANSRAQ